MDIFLLIANYPHFIPNQCQEVGKKYKGEISLFEFFFCPNVVQSNGQCRYKIRQHVTCSLILDLHCPQKATIIVLIAQRINEQSIKEGPYFRKPNTNSEDGS